MESKIDASPSLSGSSTALVVMLALTVAGCSSRRAAPPDAHVPAPVLESAVAARAACANYDRVMMDTAFPRAAIVRGIDTGRVTVRFQVTATKVRVLSIDASDPAFGEAAIDLVRQLDCRVAEPTTFEVPLAWRTSR
jgi:outer membrane biosynthesis protein TonB